MAEQEKVVEEGAEDRVEAKEDPPKAVELATEEPVVEAAQAATEVEEPTEPVAETEATEDPVEVPEETPAPRNLEEVAITESEVPRPKLEAEVSPDEEEVPKEEVAENETSQEDVEESRETIEEKIEVKEEEVEEEGEEGGEDEDDGEDTYLSLSLFSSEVFNLLGTPVEPMSSDERRPSPLHANPADPETVIKLLQDLITYDEETEVPSAVGPLDSVGRMAALSHMLAAIVTTLEPSHLRGLATRIVSDTSMWMSRLFRCFESTAFFHDDVREGIVRVCRMQLHLRYPKFAIEGFAALYARPPVIYTSSAARPGLPQHIASMIGLGTNCVRVVPCNTMIGSQNAMDTAALDRMMAEDLAAQRKPLLVIANAGGGYVGGVDNVARIQELCNNNDVWLHVEGHALAALTLPNTPNLPAKVGHSLTLPLTLWLGVPSLPYVTLYRSCDTTAALNAGLTALNLHVRLACLPLWSTLQTLGQSGVVSRIQHAFELSQQLQWHLSSLNVIRMLSPAATETNSVSIQNLISKSIGTTQLLETVCGSVVFQYVEDKTTDKKNPEYFDNLNSWLGQVVRRDVGSIPLELLQLESAGLVLRWSPLESPNTSAVTSADVARLIESLESQIEILNATVKQRSRFAELVSSAKNLEVVEIPGWAGLGGVRYIPDLVMAQDLALENTQEDVNSLNTHLVSLLKATDSAFSLGEGSDGMCCVRFGMVTADTDLSELLSLVLNTGRGIESSAKFLDQMTDVVRKGIEAATEDLKRENEERLWQEGILRHVPLVGSVYNWFSPPPPPGIKGRTLDLTAGVLESTENIYKYHMQIRHGTAPCGAETKLPPAPSVVTSVTPNATSPSHSRTSSTTSGVTSQSSGHTLSSNGNIVQKGS
ncbi:pyridoxal-dependent decarboxylase domain-containing protein 1 isoform X2 [Oratosquilla oratoria]|uniref:pyridoxal-dependent decarboxylase domain-containing protein 1 isoform X2 n=1 Tax=Oratosquilla oratoria TaxID=337810 RepID=UPI003F75FE2F